MADFNRYLGDEMKSQKGIPLDYNSGLWYPTGITEIFKYHKNKGKMVRIIQ